MLIMFSIDINHPGSTETSIITTLVKRRLLFSRQQQIVQYLKDMFDHDKVRFTSAPCLAQDLLSLSHRRSDILLGYLGIDGLQELNGALPATDTGGAPGS